MEVHHHSHHPKKWKEYITEFIMLFAAVTLGFFAENIREHRTGLNNANKSLINLYHDLQNDSIKIDYDLRFRSTFINSRSIIMEYHRNNTINEHINELYLYNSLAGLRSFSQINRMSLDEINVSGKLNFIEDDHLKLQIQKLYESALFMEIRRIRESEFQNKNLDPITIKHFDLYKLYVESEINPDSIRISNGRIVANIPTTQFNLKLNNANSFFIADYLNTINFLINMESYDSEKTIKPFAKDIKALLSQLRLYFAEKGIKYN